jgi:hypothetical protein
MNDFFILPRNNQPARPGGPVGRESRLGGIPPGNPASLNADMSGADRHKASFARTAWEERVNLWILILHNCVIHTLIAAMKRFFTTLFMFGVLLVTGCAIYTQTSFSTWQGSNTYIGQGGTVKKVDGIDIWTLGEPNRPFRLLGIIQQNHFDNGSVMSTLAGMTSDSDLVEAAKQNGGDAIIYVSRDSKITGYSATGMSTGTLTDAANGTASGAFWNSLQVNANTSTQIVVAVIKYL